MPPDRPLAVTIFVYYDYLCPFSYILLRRLDALGQERSLTVHWRPLALAPETASEPLEETPADGSDPRLALLAAQFARDLGGATFERLHRRLFEAVHEEGRDVGRRGEVLSLAAECGVDTQALGHSLDDGRYDEELEIARTEAERYGIDATPTLLVGRYKLVGAPPLEELRRTAELAAAEA